MERTKCHRAGALAIFLALTLLATGPTLAGNRDSTAAVNSVLHYKPFSEAEIAAAVQKPLALDDCIRITLSKNIPLRITKAELAKAEALHAGSYGKFFPVFTIEGTKENTLQKQQSFVDTLNTSIIANERFNNNAIVARIQQILPTGAILDFSGDLRRDLNAPDKFGALPTRTRNRLYSVQLTQPLLRNAWLRIARSEITTANYDRQMQEMQLLNAKWQTIFAVKSAFYEVLFQRELIRVNRAAIQRDSTLAAASESKVTAKLATRRDVLSAEIQLADDKAKLIKSQSDYQLALDELKEVMGLPIEMPIETVDMELSYATTPLDEQLLIRQALQNNPSLYSAVIGIDRSRVQLKVAKNQLLPQFDFITAYNGSFEENTDQNKNLRTTGLITTVSFSYPFLDRAASAKAENAQIELSQQEDNALNLERQIVLSVRNIVRSAYSSVEEINTLKRSIAAAEQKVEFASAMFNLGRASNLDITDAQDALLKAQTQYVRKLVDYHVQLALLESLTGQPATPAR